MENTALLTEKCLKLEAEIAELKTLVKFYEGQFRLAKRRQFGASSEKSEYDNIQLSMSEDVFNEAEANFSTDALEPELVDVEKHYRKRTRLTTDKLPDNLPVETIEYELSDTTCPDCGELMHVMGKEVRRELKIIPAQVSIVEHVRKVYSCRRCEMTAADDPVPVIKAKLPEPVIKGSFAAPETIAHIIAQKFVLGVPLYRQEQEWNRNGIKLSRQTMSNWLMKATEDWLEPIYDALKRQLLEQDILHADETTLQVLKEPGKTAQSKSYMWLYRTSGDARRHIVLFEYQPDRKAKRPAEFLQGFRGHLHADGYDGYHKLPEGIVVVGCLAHARRKFDEALKALPEKVREGCGAVVGKRYCDSLFELERGCAGLSVEERYKLRLEKSKPILDEFFSWAEAYGALPKSPLGQAVHYSLSQRRYLERYLLDGRLELSNNRAERSIKPFVIGRKNWLFTNTPRGATASSIIYSLIETAKENALNPYDYLVRVLRNAPNGAIAAELLPWSEPA
jgi:transposase